MLNVLSTLKVKVKLSLCILTCTTYVPHFFSFTDTLVRVTRDCSPASVSESCEYITLHGDKMKVCFKTCKFNGCNSSGKPFIYTGPYFYLLLIFLHYVTSWRRIWRICLPRKCWPLLRHFVTSEWMADTLVTFDVKNNN